RPNVRTPTARAAGIAELEIVVDSHEQYPYRFSGQQVSTVQRALPCGDYELVLEGKLVASVERKSLVDLVASLTGGKLRYALAEPENAALNRVGIASVTGTTDLDAAPDAPAPSTADVRAWARTTGLTVPDREKLRPEIWDARQAAHHGGPTYSARPAQ